MTDIIKGCSAYDSVLKLLNYFLAVGEGLDDDTLFCAAVVFSDDYVVRNVNQSSCKVSRVGSSQSCIRKSLTGSV